MHKINTDTAINNQFVNEDIVNGQSGTIADANWLNSIQNELVNIVEGFGGTLDKNNKQQIFEILKNKFDSIQTGVTQADMNTAIETALANLPVPTAVSPIKLKINKVSGSRINVDVVSYASVDNINDEVGVIIANNSITGDFTLNTTGIIKHSQETTTKDYTATVSGLAIKTNYRARAYAKIASSNIGNFKIKNVLIKRSNNDHTNMAEVEIYDNNGNNIANRATITAKNPHYSNHVTGNLIDGAYKTHHNTNVANEYWINFAFADEIKISKIVVVNDYKDYLANRSKNISLFVSEDNLSTYSHAEILANHSKKIAYSKLNQDFTKGLLSNKTVVGGWGYTYSAKLEFDIDINQPNVMYLYSNISDEFETSNIQSPPISWKTEITSGTKYIAQYDVRAKVTIKGGGDLRPLGCYFTGCGSCSATELYRYESVTFDTTTALGSIQYGQNNCSGDQTGTLTRNAETKEIVVDMKKGDVFNISFVRYNFRSQPLTAVDGGNRRQQAKIIIEEAV